MTCERTKQRQPHLQPYAGKRSLRERHAFRQAPYAVPFSAVKISLVLIITTIIGTRNALANAKSVNRHIRNPLFLSQLRGGESSAVNISSGGGQPQLNDEELDEYIDFLLAYADDQADEADNPLFRGESPLPEDIEEDTVMEEDNSVDTQESSETHDAAVELLVDDVNDDTQIDTMVEALVASIDDEELENETSVEGLDDATNTIRIPEAAEAIETAEESIHEAIIVEKEFDENDLQEVEMEVEKAFDKDVEEATLETLIGEPAGDMQGEEPAEEVEVESETFYLGSSAVEDMPLPVNEGNSSVGPATDTMLAKEDLDGETVQHTAEITTEPTKRVTLFTSFMKTIGLKKEDSEVADAIIVDPNEPIEETIDTEEDVDLEKVTEVVLDSSGAAEEPAITVSGPGSQSPIVLELGESNVPEEKVEGEISERKVAEIANAAVVNKVVDQATKASIVSPVQQYYQGSLGSIKKIWSKKRWYSRRGTKAIDEAPPERDYTKIYEKYFAANNQIPDVNEISTQEESKRLRSAFLKPWGTVTKYFTPKEFHNTEDSERSHIDDYSIGIKPFLTGDLSRATVFQANVDYNEPVETEGGIEQAETNIGSEVGTTFVEGSGETADRAEFSIAADDYREEIHIEGTSSATKDLNVEISIEETTVEAEVEELSEDAPDEAEIVTEVEVVSQEDLEDAEVVSEGQGVESVTESAEVEALSEDVEPSLAVEVDLEVVAEQVDGMYVIEDAEVTEVEADSTEVIEDAGTVTEEAELDKEEFIEDSEVTEEVKKEELVEDADTVTRVTEEDAQDDSEIITELTEVEDDSVEVIEDTEIITEVTKVEVDIDTEIVTEVTEVEVDEEEALVASEVLTESTEVEVDSEDTPEDAESIKRGTEDVDSEKVQENAAIATGIIEEGEDIQEGAEVVTELIEERVDIDIDPEELEVVTELIERDADIKEVTDVEIDNVEVLEAVTKCSEEVDIEETPESAIEDDEQDKSEDVPEDIKVERNDNQVPEGIEIFTEVIEEVDSEEVPEDAEVVIEVTEVEVDSIETQEDTEIVIERTEVEVESAEILIDTEKTLPESDESANPSADVSAEVPRRSNVFTRLWGTRKALNTFNNVKVDIEVTGIAAEDTVLEADNSIDDQKITSEDRPHQPNAFIRLWGTVKAPKETYSLGLQGVREINDSKLGEDSREISDNDAVESLEAVDDTNVLDEVNDFEIIGERVPFGSASVEGKQSERNVLQLHSPEREEKEDRRGLLENASVEVPNIVSSSEDSIENGKRTTLQLDKEIAVTVSDDVDEAEIEVDYYPNDSEEEFLNESVDHIVSEADEDSLDEADEEENAMEFGVADADQYIFTDDEDSIDEADEEGAASEFGVVDANQYISSDDEYSFEEIDEEDDAKEFRVADDDQYIASEEDKQFIENSDEEDVEVSIITDADNFIEEVDEEDLESLFVAEHVEDEYSFQQEEMEKFVEEDVSIKTYEQEEILDELEILQSDEEEIEVYANEINEEESLISEGMGSAPYSLEVEMQNANFLTRFLLKKSMGQVIMIAIVITEWFRLYIFAPFLESIEWIKDGKGQDIFQSLINMRGGALASPLINIRGGALASLSESEDVNQVIEVDEIEKGEEEEEEATAEHQCVNLNDTDKSDTDSLKDSHKGSDGQINSTESEKSTADTAPAQMPLASSPVLRPNFIFRRLLNYGFFGHVIIMEIILASEWFNLYVPQIRSMSSFIMHDLLKYKKKHGRRPGEPDNYWDSGFVNIGEGSRLPKKSRKQMKKADQRALDDLESIGNASEAKYRFVSQNFMKRHGLGPYRVAVSEIELDLESSKEGLESNQNSWIEEEDEADSDSGWILDALGVEEDKESSLSSAQFDTSVGVSISSGVPKVSVGLSMNLGKKKGKRISSQNLRSAIVGNDSTEISSKRKNSSKPHVSDSESGIMGRLRAQGANSLVGRNILGAYPGDLPPPDEAADPRGVIDMAQRYGYGDWSDEEDEVDEYAFGAFESEKSNNEGDYLADDDEVRPKKRSRRTRTKEHRSSSSRNQQSVGVGFDFDLGSSSQESVSLSNVSARRKSTVSTSRSSSSSGSASSSGSRRRRKSRSSPQSPAMEELGGSPRSRSVSSKKSLKTANRTISSTDTKIKDILTDSAARTRKTKTRTLRPAMSNLDEKNANGDQ